MASLLSSLIGVLTGIRCSDAHNASMQEHRLGISFARSR
jgi:hypothetical protein